MKKLEYLTTRLKNLCQFGAALWFSSGKDSRLLLEICLRENLPVTIFSFDETWNKSQRAFLDSLAQTQKIYSYPPRTALMVGDDQGNLSLISHYAVGQNGETVSIVRDLIDGDDKSCSLQLKIATASDYLPPVVFQTNICGSKKADRHFIFGDEEFVQERFLIGTKKFFCPLFNWSDTEVVEALKEFGINWTETEFDNTGNIPCCRKCLIGKDDVLCPISGKFVTPVDWNAVENLKNWRNSNGVEIC